jgi:hypothetical protein
MANEPKNQEPVEGDPERGDAILRRMLKSKPKPHKEAVAERKAKRKKVKPKAASDEK